MNVQWNLILIVKFEKFLVLNENKSGATHFHKQLQLEFPNKCGAIKVQIVCSTIGRLSLWVWCSKITPSVKYSLFLGYWLSITPSDNVQVYLNPWIIIIFIILRWRDLEVQWTILVQWLQRVSGYILNLQIVSQLADIYSFRILERTFWIPGITH